VAGGATGIGGAAQKQIAAPAVAHGTAPRHPPHPHPASAPALQFRWVGVFPPLPPGPLAQRPVTGLGGRTSPKLAPQHPLPSAPQNLERKLPDCACASCARKFPATICSARGGAERIAPCPFCGDMALGAPGSHAVTASPCQRPAALHKPKGGRADMRACPKRPAPRPPRKNKLQRHAPDRPVAGMAWRLCVAHNRAGGGLAVWLAVWRAVWRSGGRWLAGLGGCGRGGPRG
jgi:hypothetical protein